MAETHKRIFLSYAHRDVEAAEEVRKGLLRAGFSVWSDKEVMPGAGLVDSIATGMNESDVVVFILGSKSSSWTSVELGMATSTGKPVIPVLVDQDAEIPIMLRGIQWLNAKQYGETLQKALRVFPKFSMSH